MKRILWLALVGGLLAGTHARAGGEIYGTITTERGEKLDGPIRWDRNENAWDDFLDAEKDRKVPVRHHGSHVSILGKDLRDWIPGAFWAYPQFSIPFGHLRAIEPLGRNRARIELKNGDTLKIRESGSDLGDSIRGIVIEDPKAGQVELKWDDVGRIEFRAGPGGGRDAERLYGTVEAGHGEFTGYIVWDRDESLREDILDGDEKGHRRKIPFGEIREIRRRDGRSCEARPRSGKAMILSGTNDVNSDNRGIGVNVAGVGRVEIGWDEFQRVVFSPPPPSPRYDQFDGGRKLSGTVQTAAGESHRGRILWDEDEEYTWEVLDGEADGVDYAVLFGHIRSIERVSSRSAEVRLKDGETLVLKGSNDVNSENKGIRIRKDDGSEVRLGWGDFVSVEFEDR